MDSDLVFSDATPRSTISGMLRRGALVRLAPGVYTIDRSRPPEDVVCQRDGQTVCAKRRHTCTRTPAPATQVLIPDPARRFP